MPRKLTIAFGVMIGLVLAAACAVAWQAQAFATLARTADPAVIRDSAAQMTLTAYLVSGVTVAAAILAAVLFRGAIANPYMAALGRLDRLAAGDLTGPVGMVDRDDCVGRLAGATAKLQSQLASHATQDQTAGLDHQRLTTRLAQIEDAYRTSSESQVRTVAALGRALGRLADGDLTTGLTESLSDDFENLKADYNLAVTGLEDALSKLAGAAGGVRGGADELAAASDDMARRTEQQAASLEETAAALGQLTATVRKSAAGAKQAAEAVSTTRGEAQRSGEVVREAVSAMGLIEKSSHQISQIIGVIDEIAFQTNLLALNAGVEAARAGEAGRGFAVVAQEVRALAQRSADAAKQIKTLISTSSTQVGEGVKLVGETGEALSRIVERVGEIDTLVSEFAASSQEQATGLHQVNSAIAQMDQMTQQNAAMVAQSTSATHMLRAESAKLDQIIGRFQLGSDPYVVAASPARLPARRPPAVSSPRAASQPRAVTGAPLLAPPRPAVLTARERLNTFISNGSSGAGALSIARKPDPENGWEEF